MTEGVLLSMECHQVTRKLTDPERHDVSVPDSLQDGPQTLAPLFAICQVSLFMFWTKYIEDSE